jgi:hypothetical protein
MIKTRVEFERTLIIEWVEIFKVRKLGRDRYGFFLFGLAIENLDLMATGLEGRSKISQPNRLRPNGRLVKILYWRLNEQGPHVFTEEV